MEIQEGKEWAPWESSRGKNQLPWHRPDHLYLQKLKLFGKSPRATVLTSLGTRWKMGTPQGSEQGCLLWGPLSLRWFSVRSWG